MSQIASVTLQKKRRGNQPANHKGDPPVDTRTDPVSDHINPNPLKELMSN